ncbi:MAG: hypothetical protein NC827_05675 [Candidatus Omnitrophica bacterium]|nr:hypothetical protein [Candidatus Omnitrophota bacterium]MCM8802779.1 hypothetical protein [Candidatus Omnitrophota bacterium]
MKNQKLTLKYKDDFEQTKKYWETFWEGEIIDRPLLIILFPKDENKYVNGPSYLSGIDGNFEKPVNEFENFCENTFFFGEAIPSLNISFGPDTISYCVKEADKNVRIKSGTAWIEPFVSDWENFKKIEIDKEGEWYKKFLNFYKYASKKGDGKFLLQMPDFHTHLDLLRAIRGSENLCIDLIERPDFIKKILEETKDIFIDIYNDIYNSTNMGKYGTTCWIPLYSEKKYCTIQCDFICMISVAMFRKFALPYIEHEANFLDHSIFHLDGPGALKHLDDLLSIKKLNAVQWVPGAGNKPHIYWIDLFKKIIKAGKSVIIYPHSFEEIKTFHKELGPERIVYQPLWKIKNLKEAEEIRKYLVENT